MFEQMERSPLHEKALRITDLSEGMTIYVIFCGSFLKSYCPKRVVEKVNQDDKTITLSSKDGSERIKTSASSMGLSQDGLSWSKTTFCLSAEDFTELLSSKPSLADSKTTFLGYGYETNTCCERQCPLQSGCAIDPFRPDAGILN